MFGAYPAPPDRPSYASRTNLRERIEARQPLVHERGDPEHPDLAKNLQAEVMQTNLIAPFMTPEPLHEYDVIVHPVSGAQALGDPIERDPERVRQDLESGWTRPWVAEGIHGVVAVPDAAGGGFRVDAAATERRRVEIRQERLRRAVPFREWWEQERRRVQAKQGMADAVCDMWRSAMELSPDFARELREFWRLSDEFTF